MDDSIKKLVVHVNKKKPDVYIGRRFAGWPASKWQNPVKLHDGTTRLQVLLDYCIYLSEQELLLDEVSELRGLTLGCWCAPKMCHGHVLAQLAASEDPREELQSIINTLDAKLKEQS